MEERGGWRTTITPDLAAFIAAQTSVFLATASGDGQPYIQHRGGPAGFLHVLDDKTIAFADFSGNRQYISTGNLADNPKAHLFLIDYANRQRIKIWGEARIVEDDAELMRRLMPEGYKARPEQVLLFTVIGLGFQLSAAHPAALRRGRRGRRARAARKAHRRAGGRDRAAEGCGSISVGLTRSHSSSAPDLSTVLGRSPISFSTSSPARSARVERRVST